MDRNARFTIDKSRLTTAGVATVPANTGARTHDPFALLHAINRRGSSCMTQHLRLMLGRRDS